MGLLITPSILSSLDWYLESPKSWKEDALLQLTNQLSRIFPEEMPAPIKRGLDFEAKVYQMAKKDPGTWTSSKEFAEIVAICKGGTFQKVAKGDLKVDGVTYTLYGKMDVWFPAKIIDLKTTGKHQEPGKYLSTAQHMIYSWATNIPDFEYRVIVMDDQNKIQEHYPVCWTSPGKPEVEQTLVKIIQKFRKTLQDLNLDKLYYDKFCLYK